MKKNDKKGGMQMSKFEELLKKYDKTVDDIDFDYESLSDEELEVAFQKAFDGNSDTDNVTNEDNKFTKKLLSFPTMIFVVLCIIF